MCDLATKWNSKSSVSRNGVPPSGVVFNTGGKRDGRIIAAIDQKKKAILIEFKPERKDD